MSTLIKVTGNTARMVYDDRFHAIIAAIGRVEIKRASDVEYDHAAQEWVATYHATGEVIARGVNRNELIAAEVKWLEDNKI